mmetsp:Transcript_5569/g.6014  ORF Transcript_5569/g.6014 Transcript_5569/m.6014 type:complete len:188 (+) Transcript_5569:38-601(+)
MSQDPDARVFVANLSSRVEKADIEKFFADFGKIREVRIIPSRVNYAFVDFEDAADAREAVASKDKAEFFGKTIRLEIAKKERSGGRRREGRGRSRSGSRSRRGSRRRYSRSRSRSRDRRRRDDSRDRRHRRSRERRSRDRSKGRSESRDRNRKRDRKRSESKEKKNNKDDKPNGKADRSVSSDRKSN